MVGQSLLTNLVAYWRMESNANDTTSGAHNGTATSVTYSTVNGKIRVGAGFNGTTSKITVPDATDWTMGSGDFSFVMWIKRVSGISSRQIFMGQSNSAGGQTSISIDWEWNASNNLVAYLCDASACYPATSSGTITDGNWHHIAFTRIGNTTYLYIDGSQVGTADVTGKTMNDSGNLLGIGILGELTILPFNGDIDEVGIWKGRGLTSAEITTLFNSGNGLAYPLSTYNGGQFLQFFNH